MIVELFNMYHFIALGVFVLLVVLIGLILKNKSQSTQKKILLVLSFLNLAVHFLKLLIPKYYDDLPYSIRKITFENICAVSTLIFPFLFLSNNKYAKDYMFYMGIISGLASMIYPTEAIGKDLLDIDVLRFYFCHMMIFIVPFYMVLCDLHSLSIKRIPAFTISFMLVLAIITANEIILIETGFANQRSSDFLNHNYRNNSFIFGPTPELKEFSNKYLDIFVPKPFKEVMVGEYKGEEKYTPILWLLCPCLVYFSAFCLVIYIIFVKVLKKGLLYLYH